ncbi:MAG TPA: thioredoxin-disulfide reductase [Petrotogaceae bacterium]|nr:thioredoxin-disulfide reductase [Petrotogaceae bacterium]
MFFDISGVSKRSSQQYDIVIIGAGPAGISAAIYASQGGIKPLLIEKTIEGGQMNLTQSIENYPGILSIDGNVLSKDMAAHARAFGTEFEFSQVKEIMLEGDTKTIILESSEKITAKVIIVASGANPRFLGAKNEQKYISKGVSYCASCDGHFFKNKKIAVVGGGNTAVQESIFLSKIAQEVVLIHRRDKLRADKIYQDRIFKISNIRYLWDSEVVEINGDTKVESLTIKNVKDQSITSERFDGVFIFVGAAPSTSFIKELVKLDQEGYIITDENMESSVSAIYAVGDVRHKELRQIVTAVADGAIAAAHAVRKYFS